MPKNIFELHGYQNNMLSCCRICSGTKQQHYMAVVAEVLLDVDIADGRFK